MLSNRSRSAASISTTIISTGGTSSARRRRRLAPGGGDAVRTRVRPGLPALPARQSREPRRVRSGVRVGVRLRRGVPEGRRRTLRRVPVPRRGRDLLHPRAGRDDHPAIGGALMN